MAGNSRDDRYFPYTTKRARQACENCRRKKSKCSGEKPECSFCVRLRQRCVYARYCRTRSRDEDDSDVALVPPIDDVCHFEDKIDTDLRFQQSSRLSVIEGRLERLTAALEYHIPSSSGDVNNSRYTDKEPPAPRPSCNPSNPPSTNQHTSELAPTWSSIEQELQLPEAVINEGIELYFRNYCNQPCPNLARMGSKELPAIEELPTTVLYPMLALSLRSTRHPLLQEISTKQHSLDRISQLSWGLLSKAYSDFAIDDAYFQGLCLLAQADFGEGRVDRAQAQIALGLRLAQSRGMLCARTFDSLSNMEQEYRQEIVWSLFMLDRMIIGRNIKEPSVPISSFELPIFQGGPLGPGPGSRQLQASAVETSSGQELLASMHSVVSLNVELIQIWQTVLSDITRNPSVSEVPFWRHDSTRAAIITRLLDFEAVAGYHSYASTGPPTRAVEEPQLRSYFLSWLHFQLIHSVIHCCLNHPFITFIRTKRLKSRVPLTFLQKSYEYSMIYANWVFRLLSEMEDAGLALHDPFLGYIVAIAASIHLEHTLSKYPTVASSARRKFDKCFDFVKGASEEWPNMRVAASIVEHLRARLSRRSNMNYVESEYDGAVPSRPTLQISLEEEDEQLMWRLFDYASMSASSSGRSRSQFDWTPDIMNRGSLSEVNSPSHIVDLVAQESQCAPSLSSGQTEDPHMKDLLPISLPAFESIETCSGDWSLFGRPWLDYFPLDDGMNYS